MIVYRHPNLQGLEIWHGLARRATLYQLRNDKPAYFAALDEFLDDLHAGIAQTAEGNSLHEAAGFERLIITGGEAAEASAHLKRPHSLQNPGPFAARPGAEAVWRQFNWRNPLAIDAGQSRIKVMSKQASFWIERTDIIEAIRPVIPKECDGVVLALPTGINEKGEAGPCSYAGLYGPIEPIFRDLFAGKPWAVCNDAVLAARGYPPANNEKTLILTLGFGIGAALWQKPVP